MSVILILIGASLLVAGGFLVAFIWAVKSGQYEDKYTPSVRMLFDDELRYHDENNEEHKNKNVNTDEHYSKLKENKLHESEEMKIE